MDFSKEPEVPEYRWVQGDPIDPNGCTGCAFQFRLFIRCSRIPCQNHPGMVAELVREESDVGSC